MDVLRHLFDLEFTIAKVSTIKMELVMKIWRTVTRVRARSLS